MNGTVTHCEIKSRIDRGSERRRTDFDFGCTADYIRYVRLSLEFNGDRQKVILDSFRFKSGAYAHIDSFLELRELQQERVL